MAPMIPAPRLGHSTRRSCFIGNDGDKVEQLAGCGMPDERVPLPVPLL
jgi:hypothetical protein